MWKELGISSGTGILILFALYFVIKWAVKNGIRDYYREKEEEAAMQKQLDEHHNAQDEV